MVADGPRAFAVVRRRECIGKISVIIRCVVARFLKHLLVTVFSNLDFTATFAATNEDDRLRWFGLSGRGKNGRWH